MVAREPGGVTRGRFGGRDCSGMPAGGSWDGVMKFALVNPAWSFEGSTYFGCQEPHYPLELLFAADKIHEGGHEALLVDAQLKQLSVAETNERVATFDPDFLVLPTAPS